MGIPLLGGRALTSFDKADSAPVVLINQTLARRHWLLEDPVGKRISFDSFGQTMNCEIVGVAGDVRPRGLDSEPRPEIYLPYAQSPFGSVTWLVRTAGDPLSLLPAVKEKIPEVNPTQTFASIATMEQLLDRSTGARRFNLFLLGSFAALALLLAGIGLYGLISYTTAQRTHVKTAVDTSRRIYANFLARPALRRANVIEETRLHFDCRAHARFGHRREHSHIEHGEWLHPPPAAGNAS